ncbi:exosortase F system-associated membrane protein [Flavobacterium sp.]|uniref:exosortase F system-associated membrane protein n=1 Tax=Flavobacterium sp. TaxID=239 RepID=UPI003D0C3C24
MCGIVLVLALIRLFESEWFYDPFINYFKGEFIQKPYPEINVLHLSLHLMLRYFLNALLTLAMIYVLFRSKSMLKMTAFLLILFYCVLFIAFFILLFFFDESHAMTLFYVRRFIIQPLFLLLFVPAFYYHNLVLNSQTSKK